MKRKVALLLSVSWLFCLLPIGASAVQITAEELVRKLFEKNTTVEQRDEEKNYVRVSHSQTINVREEPTADSKWVGTAAPESTYVYLGQEDNWYLIQYNDRTKGYVSANLSVVEDESGEIVKDTTGENSSRNVSRQENNTKQSSEKTCPTCKGRKICKYCVAGRRYAGGDKMETCPFCFGSMMCYMCGGRGTTR